MIKTLNKNEKVNGNTACCRRNGAMVGCSKTPVKEAAKNDAINLANLDTAVAPGTDFYQYACGGWMKNNPLKPEYARSVHSTSSGITIRNRSYSYRRSQ